VGSSSSKRRGQDAGAKREPLLPAPRQLARELVGPALESKAVDGFRGGAAWIGNPIDAGDEFEVLADGEIRIQTEALGHVAHIALDLVGLGEDIVAKAGAPVGVGREQPAQHADGGGLAAAVRPEEAVDLPLGHFQGQVLDHNAVAEGLGQPLDVDGDLLH